MKRKLAVGVTGPMSTRRQRKMRDEEDENREATSVTGGNNFDRLPPEMVRMILSYVADTSTLSAMNARQVCMNWDDIISSMLTFQGTLTDDNIHVLAGMHPDIPLKYLVLTKLEKHKIGPSLHDKRLCIRNGNGGNTYDASKFQRSVEHLVIGGDVGKFLKMYGRTEQPFSISSGFAEDHSELPFVKDSIGGTDLVNILTQLRDVKMLTLTSIAFLSVSNCMLRQLDFSMFSTLTKLDICMGKKSCLKKMQYFFEKTSCPNLTSLYIRMYSSCYNFGLYVAYIKFIAKHPFLKNLSLSQAMALFTIDANDLKEPMFTLQYHPSLAEDLLKIQLRCLRLDCVVINHSIANEWKNLERIFLKNQTQLSSLDLYWTQRRMDCRLDELLPSCGMTLEHLELSSDHIAPNHFNCSTISNYEKLARCNLYLRTPIHLDEESRDMDWEQYGTYSYISNIEELPPSLTSLHLAALIPLKLVRKLGRRLKNLERISYGGTVAELGYTPRYFALYLLEHLKFPSLFELRFYRFSCLEILDELNRYPGIHAIVEDEDCLVVYVNNEVCKVESICQFLPPPNCRCNFV